jgi:glycolate oxidase FAD binding subunit
VTAAAALAPHVESVPDELRATAPAAEFVAAPETVEAAAEVLLAAARNGLSALVWGAGSHQGYGHPVSDPDVVLITTRMNRIVDWVPDDLTLVVEGGVRIAEIDELLAEKRQSPVLPEQAGEATVGGVVAAGISGYRRLRYGPTRDRMLEVVLATGDGRVVTGGGRLVKNVTGYDLPRLVTGSLGALGVVGSVCLKLWPRPAFEATVAVGDPSEALRVAYRPLAIVETETASFAFLGGTEAEVRMQAADLGSDPVPGLAWPQPLDQPHRFDLRVPARLTAEAASRARSLHPDGLRVAHGVGEIRLGFSDPEPGSLQELRGWAEHVGGALIVAAGPGAALIDPWGTPPPSVPLQRRVKEAFDPRGVVNPGRLPGGI